MASAAALPAARVTLTEQAEEVHNVRFGVEVARSVLIKTFNGEGKVVFCTPIRAMWARDGDHNAHSLQTAARLLTKLAAGDWRGASLLDVWADWEGVDGKKHIPLLNVPGSLTQGVDLYWTVRQADGNLARPCRDGSGFESHGTWTTPTAWTKMSDAAAHYILEIHIRGDGSLPTVLSPHNEGHGEGIQQIAAWMLARAVEWEPSCILPPSTWLVLFHLQRGPKRVSPAFATALVERGIDPEALMASRGEERADPRVIEAALAVGIEKLGTPQCEWRLQFVPAAARLGLVTTPTPLLWRSCIHETCNAAGLLDSERLQWDHAYMLQALYHAMRARRGKPRSVRFEWDWGYGKDKETQTKADEMTRFIHDAEYTASTRVAWVCSVQ